MAKPPRPGTGPAPTTTPPPAPAPATAPTTTAPAATPAPKNWPVAKTFQRVWNERQKSAQELAKAQAKLEKAEQKVDEIKAKRKEEMKSVSPQKQKLKHPVKSTEAWTARNPVAAAAVAGAVVGTTLLGLATADDGKSQTPEQIENTQDASTSHGTDNGTEAGAGQDADRTDEVPPSTAAPTTTTPEELTEADFKAKAGGIYYCDENGNLKFDYSSTPVSGGSIENKPGSGCEYEPNAPIKYVRNDLGNVSKVNDASSIQH